MDILYFFVPMNVEAEIWFQHYERVIKQIVLAPYSTFL